MNIKYILSVEKKDSNGKCPIRLLSYYSGQRLVYNIGEKCYPKDFDDGMKLNKSTGKKERKHEGKFKRSFPGYQEANDYLEELSDKIKRFVRESKLSGKISSPSEIKRHLQPAKVSKQENTVLDLMNEWIDEETGEKAERTIKNYNGMKNHYEKFVVAQRKDLTLLEFDEDWLNAFEGFHGLQENSLCSINNRLKAFLKWTKKKKIESHIDTKNIVAKSVFKPPIPLTTEEIEILEKTEFGKVVVDKFVDKKGRTKERVMDLDKEKDCYLFMCFTGQAYTDSQRMTPKNLIVSEGYQAIASMRQKTITSHPVRFEIPLSNKAIALIKKYEGKQETLMPFSTNAVMNRALKEIGKRANINSSISMVEDGKIIMVPKWKKMTTHTARDTYATQSLILGIPERIIADNMGLSSTKHLDKYIKIVKKFKHQATLEAWNK